MSPRSGYERPETSKKQHRRPLQTYYIPRGSVENHKGGLRVAEELQVRV